MRADALIPPDEAMSAGLVEEAFWALWDPSPAQTPSYLHRDDSSSPLTPRHVWRTPRTGFVNKSQCWFSDRYTVGMSELSMQ
jgi:hypothetical protein